MLTYPLLLFGKNRPNELKPGLLPPCEMVFPSFVWETVHPSAHDVMSSTFTFERSRTNFKIELEFRAVFRINVAGQFGHDRLQIVVAFAGIRKLFTRLKGNF